MGAGSVPARYLVYFQYLGTDFNGVAAVRGVQRAVGVQNYLEEAAERLNSVMPVKFTISSRTDAGVHALSNAAHLDIQRRSDLPPFSPEVLTEALNTHLKHPAIRQLQFWSMEFESQSFLYKQVPHPCSLLAGPQRPSTEVTGNPLLLRCLTLPCTVQQPQQACTCHKSPLPWAPAQVGCHRGVVQEKASERKTPRQPVVVFIGDQHPKSPHPSPGRPGVEIKGEKPPRSVSLAKSSHSSRYVALCSLHR
ncbi:tRNA pseudouridine synthase-like 1 isoform X4 [Bos javanicus]|uniref:tRNA pseudouridine synthase-like 1 isoform X4 n=1 Tax=Bos javanicus TaxID=9906 RepID=UPI002AA87943|nr:tRNA pseudouridine synthase-like 1 isoform X4 [Bos javanicus]